MTDQTILVVEDDTKVSRLLRNVLEGEGFSVREAQSRAEVLDAVVAGRIDLITLDIQLGADNGLELAREIRRQSSVPIVMVTGKDDLIDRVVGLELGADDYITKPFHVREVVARIRSVLRRAPPVPLAECAPPGPSLGCPPAVDDSRRFAFDGMIATPDRLELQDRTGGDCALTSGDYRLLTVFLERPKRVLSRDQLMDLIGGQAWSPLDRTIDNQVARLRKKIERNPSDPKLIKTVRGIGYTLACDVEALQPGAAPAKSA
ncbi:response regulator [Roseobacter sinensis]|uniref:Response regulator transcription factor n=1 Tax=Roseobacter sinensis TaxID=2931391 RepID=A0ABT3BDM0_9RHOB|nr:response regulator transcription factor [Roseobacter sp. WL0113]MCV3271494.1 response regulator transcription factor [Roseobacter sp. WL0113]